MTYPDDGQAKMPDNPGDPAATDPEATSPEQAEAAADAVADAQAEARAEGKETFNPEAVLEEEAEAKVQRLSAEDEVLGAEAPAEEADPITGLEEQLEERTDDLKRVTAEYANYRRRTERERGQIAETAKAQVLSSLLPILDDLELARQHGDLEEGPLRAFADKLQNTLGGFKLTPFGEPGEDFDPEIHEAVQDLSEGDHKVLGTVLRRGFRVGEKVVRTAMVIIADPQENNDGAAGTQGAAGTEES